MTDLQEYIPLLELTDTNKRLWHIWGKKKKYIDWRPYFILVDFVFNKIKWN